MAAAAGRDEWACERCTYLNTEDALQCVMCEWEEPSRTMTTTPTTRDVHAASHRMPTTAPLALHAVTPPSIATATTTTATNNIIAPPPRVVVARPVHHSVPSARPSSYDNGTWDISIMGLVGRMVTPAKFIFNGTLTGVFAFAGACTGAVAGAIAARATRRGVMRGAGIGALAGAAISIEALDLGRLFLRGHTVAGAIDHRETRLGAFDHAAATAAASGQCKPPEVERINDECDLDDPASGRSGHIRSAARARRAARNGGGSGGPSGGGGGGQHRSTMHHLEIALAEGDVELVLHELLTGVVVTHTQSHRDREEEEGEGGEGIGVIDTRGENAAAGDGDVDGYGGFSNAAEAAAGVGDGGGGGEGDYGITTASGDRRGGGGGGGSFLARQRRRQSQLHQLLEAILLQANVDSMTYEELLERFGPGVDGPAAAPASLISSIPRRKLTGEDVEAAVVDDAREWRCCICLEDYCKGDVVKSLPSCAHCFHAGCIDTWLAGRNLCPICRVVGVEEGAGAGVVAGAAASAAA